MRKRYTPFDQLLPEEQEAVLWLAKRNFGRDKEAGGDFALEAGKWEDYLPREIRRIDPEGALAMKKRSDEDDAVKAKEQANVAERARHKAELTNATRTSSPRLNEKGKSSGDSFVHLATFGIIRSALLWLPCRPRRNMWRVRRGGASRWLLPPDRHAPRERLCSVRAPAGIAEHSGTKY